MTPILLIVANLLRASGVPASVVDNQLVLGTLPPTHLRSTPPGEAPPKPPPLAVLEDPIAISNGF